MVLSLQANVEIRKAYHYYTELLEQAADSFFMEVESSLDSLQNHRKYDQVRYKSYSFKWLIKFRYGIHFIVDNERKLILVEGFYHQKQKTQLG